MKILITFLTIFISFNTFAISYILVSDGDKSDRYQRLVNSLEAGEMFKPVKKESMLILTESGYKIESGKIYQFFDDRIFGERGKQVKCTGLQGKCLIINGTMKIYIPSDFSFDLKRSWEWQDYKYVTVARLDYSLFGQQFDAIEILAFCNSCEEHVVRFTYDKIRGVIDFDVETKYYSLKYVLSDKVGFLAPK